VRPSSAGARAGSYGRQAGAHVPGWQPSGTAIEFPSHSHALDYELHAFVIGEPLYDAAPGPALEGATERIGRLTAAQSR
jgi:hypothetical protein